MLIGLPSFYGAWHGVLTGITQHIGLAEDVLDHRLNCRTVYMNPFSRFVYWNMNYHVEHHMFPNVPYHALPALHEAMKADCPPAYPSIWAAYSEIVPTLIRQLKDPTYFARARPAARGRRRPSCQNLGSPPPRNEGLIYSPGASCMIVAVATSWITREQSGRHGHRRARPVAVDEEHQAAGFVGELHQSRLVAKGQAERASRDAWRRCRA